VTFRIEPVSDERISQIRSAEDLAAAIADSIVPVTPAEKAEAVRQPCECGGDAAAELNVAAFVARELGLLLLDTIDLPCAVNLAMSRYIHAHRLTDSSGEGVHPR
jgi:hypothetical protein